MPTEAVAKLDEIFVSPTNPRKTYDAKKLEELAETLVKQGMLQPLLVRKATGDHEKKFTWELIFGTRRLKAAKIAKLEAVPIRIVEMTDGEVIEAQVVENGQRDDIHPLEEAEGYEQMLHPPKGATFKPYTAEQIAAKVGKSESSVYARLKLLSLTKANRGRFYAGEIDASRALLLARIPNEKLQDQAGEEISRVERHSGDSMGFREAQRWIQDHFMLRLAEAPFDIADAGLVATAGACGVCPKRTGNQSEMFADVAGADVCTDPPCFKTKIKAHGDMVILQAEKKGQKIMAPATVKQVFAKDHGDKWSPAWNADYVRADDKPYELGGKKSYRQALGKEAAAKVVIARAPDGSVHELLPREVVKKLRRERQKTEKTPEDVRRQKDEAKRKEAMSIRGAVCEAAALEAADKASAKNLDTILRAALPMMVRGQYHPGWMQRRGLKHADKVFETAQKLAAEAKTTDQLLGLLIEILTDDWDGDVYSGYPRELVAFFEALGVDVEEHEASIAAGLEDVKAAKAVKTSKKGSAKQAPAAAQ